jgi:glycosyltransferase involved in cell wall biosynthesis
MRKLFIFLAIMLAALTSWAQNWEPRDIETFTKNYDSLVLELSQEEQKQLSDAINTVKNELKIIRNIKFYTNGGWPDYYALKDVTEILQNIKSLYENLDLDVRELFGGWMALQYVQTEDKQIGLLDNFLIIIADEYVNSDKQLAFDLAMLSYKIQMNYDSVLNR